MSNAVFNETVLPKYTGGNENVRFSNADWIKEQIKANSLMKHPSAMSWYQTMPTADTLAVEQEIKINTRRVGSVMTGVYVVPGEVAKIKLGEKTFNFLRENYTDTIQVVNKYLGAINDSANYYGSWIVEDNNTSLVKGSSLTTDKVNDYLEFSKKMKAFVLYGNTSSQPVIVDIYEDGKLIKQNYKISSTYTMNGVKLFVNRFASYDQHTIKIVNKSSTPLTIDYFGYEDN
ncbi:hypothetical protein [[Mycoplasma] imitans]|uniref:hypothetical protein n=1 Tax=[Mycoplasma] imitans TaxID=29560 RepID=UPI0005661818|nr:hypothetical protein [[Mycoplasma] imitans]